MIVLDFLQQKPEHAKLRAKSNEQRDAEQKKEAETEPKVTFEEAYTKPKKFWVEFARAHPTLDEKAVSKSKTKAEAASWAALERVRCFEVDEFALFGADFFSKKDIIQDLRNSGSRMITSKFTIMVSQTA